MDSISPIVITSKAATKDLNTIRSQHSDILQGMQDQSMRVDAFKKEQEAQKQMMDQQNQVNQMDSQKMQMEANTKKMEAENKQRELDIKAAALSM